MRYKQGGACGPGMPCSFAAFGCMVLLLAFGNVALLCLQEAGSSSMDATERKHEKFLAATKSPGPQRKAKRSRSKKKSASTKPPRAQHQAPLELHAHPVSVMPSPSSAPASKPAPPTTLVPSEKVQPKHLLGNVSLPLRAAGMQWVGDLVLGTPPQTVSALFDTGSKELWVASRCAKVHRTLRWKPGGRRDFASCPGFNRTYNDSASSTAVNLEEAHSVRYGSAEILGATFRDVVQLGGVRLGSRLLHPMRGGSEGWERSLEKGAVEVIAGSGRWRCGGWTGGGRRWCIWVGSLTSQRAALASIPRCWLWSPPGTRLRASPRRLLLAGRRDD
eukprot:gnl/TRDRNA2_/TRDRNA2_168299_c0_seq1.p2 gnl/TRDRNA2_/TRDRNA2_168299_c0~~gnl/TRDRNA2_/TRDRNA2_168299_c0_seq1.p2  ORF type:complete len:332 (+),score=49.51 gnl/TRDRNA2_/TRDRNA2_168299_c0_seq1:3-998(+)